MRAGMPRCGIKHRYARRLRIEGHNRDANVPASVRRRRAAPCAWSPTAILVLSPQGEILVAQLLSSEGARIPVAVGEPWADLPIVKRAMADRRPIVSTEVIPAEFLSSVGLDKQAYVELVDTPKAAAGRCRSIHR